MKNEDFIFIKKMFKKRKKFKQYLKINGKVICHIKDIKITKNNIPYAPPAFNENTPGWNQGIQDVLKEYPSIPINVEENIPQPKTLFLPKGFGFGLNLPKDQPSCLNHFLTKYAEYKLTNNEIDDDKKDEVISMISEYHQGVREKRIKDMLTGVIISLD